MANQLTSETRKVIEKGLRDRLSLKQIAAATNKHCSSISREIRSHYVTEQKGGFGQRFNECANRFGCQYTKLCDLPECKGGKCRNCDLQLCRKVCPDFERQICQKLDAVPYVCNGCTGRSKCSLEKHFYRAAAAQREADAVRSESRTGTHLTPLEIAHVRKIVVPALKKGQSVHHIWASNKDTLMISERTLYQMVEDGPLSDCTMELRQKVSRKPVKTRYKSQNHDYKVDPECKQGRHYEDYLQFMEEHPDLHVVEMDTVEGEKGSKVILTLHFVAAQFMLGFLRPRNDARSVRDVFNDLTERLGLETFRVLFPVFLTDNGSEFTDPEALETDPVTGEQRTRIFYCHPNSPFEKGAAEKNHTLMRYVLPKRKSSFRSLTQEQVTVMMNHVNSYLRSSCSDAAAFDLFRCLFDPDEEVIRKLGLTKIAPADVWLRPELIRNV